MNSIHIQREERIEGCCGVVLLLVLAFPPLKWHTFWFTACQDHPEKLLYLKAYWLLSSVEYNLWSHWHVRLSCLNFPRSSLLRCDSQEQTPLIISLPMVTGSNTVMTSSQLPFGYISSCCMDKHISKLLACSLFTPPHLWTILQRPTLHCWAQQHGRHEGIKQKASIAVLFSVPFIPLTSMTIVLRLPFDDVLTAAHNPL